jgi:hypothetical protein
LNCSNQRIAFFGEKDVHIQGSVAGLVNGLALIHVIQIANLLLLEVLMQQLKHLPPVAIKLRIE